MSTPRPARVANALVIRWAHALTVDLQSRRRRMRTIWSSISIHSEWFLSAKFLSGVLQWFAKFGHEVLSGLKVRKATCAPACLIHDSLDGVGAPATLSPTAETGIDLAHASRLLSDGRTDLVIAEYVAGTDDHRRAPNQRSERTPKRRRSPRRHRSIRRPMPRTVLGTSQRSVNARMGVADDARSAGPDDWQRGVPL